MGKMTDRDSAGRGGAVTEDMDREHEESPVSDIAPDAPGGRESRDRVEREPRAVRQARPGGGLRIYKPGQGYYTRIGTAIGAGVLIIAGGAFLFNQLGAVLDVNKSYTLPVQYGASIGFMIALSILVYWIVGVNRRTNDFFIATEGEMKKVNWSSRKEIVRSTKVVIVTVLLMAVLLFVVDVLFMLFFHAIGVLKGGPGILELFGGSKT